MASAGKRPQENLGQSGQNLIRVLIASYFVGVSIGLVPGTSATPLFAMVIAGEQAELMGRAVIFALAYLVMTGLWLRPAALLLGLVTFWSSYIVNFSPEGPISVGNFWRDLTLIGSLMLTYVQSTPRSTARRKMIRRRPRARRIVPGAAVVPRRVATPATGRPSKDATGPAVAASASAPAGSVSSGRSPRTAATGAEVLSLEGAGREGRDRRAGPGAAGPAGVQARVGENIFVDDVIAS